MADIKPIETVYAGYRFRSRLEARWAVFFDTLGLRWEYEPEGYDLGELGYYLPDFYLPEVHCFTGADSAFIEIKPDHFPSDTICKAQSLAGKFDGKREVHICMSLPGELQSLIFIGGSKASSITARMCHLDGELGFVPDGLIVGLEDGSLVVEPTAITTVTGWITPDYYLKELGPMPDLERAFSAAKRARFEHGERGR